jgi:hypothetical protein
LREPFITEPFGTKEAIEPERRKKKKKKKQKSKIAELQVPLLSYIFTMDKVAVSSIE